MTKKIFCATIFIFFIRSLNGFTVNNYRKIVTTDKIPFYFYEDRHVSVIPFRLSTKLKLKERIVGKDVIVSRKKNILKSLKIKIQKSFDWIKNLLLFIKEFLVTSFLSKILKSNNKTGENTINSQETIDSVIAMAEKEKDIIPESSTEEEFIKEENIISVIVSDDTLLNENINFNPIKQEDLEAARKVVEKKLLEIEKREILISRPVFNPELTNVTVIELLPIIENQIEETDGNKLIESFPDVVSEKTTDHTYMTHEYGPVDPYASVDDKFYGKKSEDWKKIKSAGVSGIIAYVLTELSFWILFPACVYLYESINNQNIDLNSSDGFLDIVSAFFLCLNTFSTNGLILVIGL